MEKLLRLLLESLHGLLLGVRDYARYRFGVILAVERFTPQEMAFVSTHCDFIFGHWLQSDPRLGQRSHQSKICA
jgi:hypothetical protein